ncbi:MFS transporter [Sphaerisporangium sp. NPDC088356]|uniref:MFS transporter n=1 Tax=Sphaerisporangium sp. NPDC088356 TaxID=3154871 RepID=UPI003437241B
MAYETIQSVMHANVPLRFARSTVFAVVCVTLAAVAHWFAGGAGPAPVTLLSGGLAIMTITAVPAGRERSPVTVTGLLLAAQVFLHHLLGPRSAEGLPSAPHMPHGIAHLPGLPQGHGLGVDAGMLLAHLTATLLTGWWLSRGEAALWSALRGAGAYAVRRLAVLLRPEVAPAPRVPPRRAETAVLPPAQGQVLRHAVVRRGPPVLLVP